MFRRRILSKDERYYLVEVECRDKNHNLYEVYLNGSRLSRAFLSEEDLRELESKIINLINSGKLMINHRRIETRGSITSISIKRAGELLKVELQTDSKLKKPKEKIRPLPYEIDIKMHPTLTWRISQKIKKLIEEDDPQEFINLLNSISPLVEERGITEFDGKTIHPISIKTILSRMEIYSKGLINKHKRESRTIILLDRSLSMANPWSPWDAIPKIRIGRFLVKVIQNLQYNNHLFSFGEYAREEADPLLVEAIDDETRLDLALKEVELYYPEKLVVITDGRPVYSADISFEKLSEECIYMLDSLSRSGVRILIIMLGRDPDLLKFYRMLEENDNVSLIHLSAEKHNLINLLHALSTYLNA